MTAREAELKTRKRIWQQPKPMLISLTNNIAAQKQQLTVDEQAMVAAKGTVDTDTAALPPFQEASAAKEQALAAVQQEVNRTNALVTSLAALHCSAR